MDELHLSELKTRVEADDPAALFEYSELLRESDHDAAHKYLHLSAQLGYPAALERVGDEYLASGDTANAEQCYKSCAKAGLLTCSVKLAALRLDTEEQAALAELEELAELGIPSAYQTLAEYYAAHGNKREAAYWADKANGTVA